MCDCNVGRKRITSYWCNLERIVQVESLTLCFCERGLRVLGADSKGGRDFINCFPYKFFIIIVESYVSKSNKYEIFESSIKHIDQPLQPPRLH